MSRRVAVVKLDSRFEARVNSLANEGVQLSAAYVDVTKRILKFSQSLYELWEKAQELDSGSERGEHRRYLVDEISEAIGTDSKTIRSRWLMIGQQASTLNSFKAALPPARDNLYEVALAAKDNKPVQKWIEEGTLTPESSVRDIRKLRDQKRQTKKGRKKTATPKAFPASVTLCFQSYDDALKLLEPLLLSNEAFKVVADKTFANILATLEGDDYVKASKKLG